MTKVDLITGFLGAGKTTFLKLYARYWMSKGCSIGIIENDYGAVNVDMMLLEDLESSQCDLQMVAGACDKDCHRRRFKTKLISMGMLGYDRVIVEPSGIYDVDEFFDVLNEPPIDRMFTAGSVITIVDAGLEPNPSDAAKYLLATQSANAGVILLSRTQLYPQEIADRAVGALKTALKTYGCSTDIDSCIIAKDWKDLASSDYERIKNAGFRQADHIKLNVDDDGSFSSVYYLNMPFTKDKLSEIASELFSKEDCGKIIRIKGFTRNLDNTWTEMNATSAGVSFSQRKDGQQVIIIIGEKLNKTEIDKYMR